MRQGKPIVASLDHLVFLPTSAPDKFPTIIALHGRGADENDLASLLLALELPGVLLVTPRAPFAFPYGGYAWYRPDEAPDLETVELLRRFIEEIKAGYPVNTRRLILMGFSQGAMMTYAVALANPSPFRGIAALSGYVPHQANPQHDGLAGFPVFISHGTNDPLIPVRLGREAAKLLMNAGADVTYREYIMGHEIGTEASRDLRHWLLGILTRT